MPSRGACIKILKGFESLPLGPEEEPLTDAERGLMLTSCISGYKTAAKNIADALWAIRVKTVSTTEKTWDEVFGLEAKIDAGEI